MFSNEITDRIRAKSGWFLAAGVFSTLLGLTALVMSGLATFVTVLAIGAFMLASGLSELVQAIATRTKGAFGRGLVGVLYASAGCILIAHPFSAAFTLTAFMAAFFVVSGVVKLFLSFQYRRFRFGIAMLINGMLSLVLGCLIYMQWPLSALWVIGSFVGINLLADGISWITVAFTAHSLPSTSTRSKVA